MSKPVSATDRRSFLKSGAIAAAPLAVVVPGAAMALDDKAARLARIEDERAIEALHRGVLRRMNGDPQCREARHLCDNFAALADDPAAEPALEFAPDGCRATARRACRVERDIAFAGDSTIERMARFQGQGQERVSEARVLVADYIKRDGSWAIDRLRLV